TRSVGSESHNPTSCGVSNRGRTASMPEIVHRLLNVGRMSVEVFGELPTSPENCRLGASLSGVAELVLMLRGQVSDGDLIHFCAQRLVAHLAVFQYGRHRVWTDTEEFCPLADPVCRSPFDAGFTPVVGLPALSV